MKRTEILKTVKDEKIDIESVIEQDLAFLKKTISDKKYDLSTAERSIKSFLKNAELVMDSEFITLYKNKKKLESEIEVLEEIIKEYV